jgi:hypothetical protein
VVLHDPEKDRPKPSVPPAAPVPPSASNPPGVPVPVTPPPLPVAGTATSPVPVSALPAGDKLPVKRTMRLSAVVDYITSLVGNASLGHLLVYRVFLRVPPDLLLAEDIASVHLSGDTSLISGEKLQKAVADALYTVAKKTLPDSVYAAA